MTIIEYEKNLLKSLNPGWNLASFGTKSNVVMQGAIALDFVGFGVSLKDVRF